jgi:hypothetical protein
MDRALDTSDRTKPICQSITRNQMQLQACQPNLDLGNFIS